MTETRRLPAAVSAMSQKTIEFQKKLKEKRDHFWSLLPTMVTRTPSASSKCQDVIQYRRGAYLGKGACARVYELQDLSTGHVYAGKIVAKVALTMRSKRHLLTELQIHKSINHDGVVQYHGHFEDNNFLYILLELCAHQSLMGLLQHRKRLLEDEVRYYMKDAFEGLHYLRENCIIHRDLKLRNMLLDENMRLKIADFGLATRLKEQNERKKSMCGTPNYIAPEILLATEQGHSFEVDVWSMGVILYTLLVGRPPFESKDYRVTYQRIVENIYSFPPEVEISVDAKNLIRELLHPEAKCRPSITQALAHPFFTGHMIPQSVPISSLRFTPRPRTEESRKPEAYWEESCTPPTPNKKPRPFQFATRRLSSRNPLAPTSLNTVTSPTNASRKRQRAHITHSDENGDLVEQQPTKKRKLSVPRSPEPTTAPTKTSTSPPAEEQLEEILRVLNDMVGGKPVQLPQLPPSHDEQANKEPLHVARWVESQKAGIGFQLSDHTTCIYFNDDTKLAFNPVSHMFHYWTPRADTSKAVVYLNEDQEITYHLTDSRNKELQKKTDILLRFRHYFLYEKQSGFNDVMQAEMSRRVHAENDLPPCPYVQRFIRTDYAMTFKLSTGSVQTNFVDHTKMLTHIFHNQFVYINSKGDQKLFEIDAFDGASRLISSRARYVRDNVKVMVRIKSHSTDHE